jgi:hypothetical protein
MNAISESCGGGAGGRALVPGSLRGYRTWRLRRRGSPAGMLPLTSVTRSHVVWSPALTAVCMPVDIGMPWPLAIAADHHAPQVGCQCGIYAWYEPRDSGIVSSRVFGAVEASGLVLLGERGFRAERARITAVVTRNRRLAAACARTGISVYTRRRDLLRDYPPEDVTELIGGGGTSEPPPPLAGGPGGLIGLLAVAARTAVMGGAAVAPPPARITVVLAAHLMAILTFLAHVH